MSIKQTILEQFHFLERTSPGRALAHRRESNLVINTMFRSLAGRYPDAEERAALVRLSLEGASFDEMALQAAMTEAGVDRLIERIRPAVRARLLWDHERAAADQHGFPERIVFLHIMKTGGLALSQVCADYPAARGRSWAGLYIDDLLLPPRAVIARLAFISGHFPYQALTIIPGPFKTATVLREPIARAISHFSELRRTEPAYEHVSLEDFVTEDHSVSGNYQARQLAHRIDLDGAWSTYDPFARLEALGGARTQFPVASLFDTTPLDCDDDSLLDTAAQNLAGIDLVGVTEDMSTVGAAIAELFGGDFTGIPRFHVSPAFDYDELTDRVRKKLDARTAVDRELYDQARRRVEAQRGLEAQRQR